MTPKKKSCLYRPYEPSDASYIINSWCEVTRRESPFAAFMDSQTFFPNHRQIIESLLASSGCLVACPYRVRSRILGFICSDELVGQKILHFLYVRKELRGTGLERELLRRAGFEPKKPIVATHVTYECKKLIERKKLIYNIYPLFAHLAQSQETL